MSPLFHKLLVVFLLSITINNIYAQCSDSPANCSLNLKQPVFPGGNVILIKTISYAKSPLSTVFTDVKYKDDDYKPGICDAPLSTTCETDGNIRPAR